MRKGELWGRWRQIMSNSASPPERRARGPRAGPRDVAGGESAGTDPINAAWGREGDWGAPGVAGHSFASQITSAYLAAVNPDGVCLMFICVSAAG